MEAIDEREEISEDYVKEMEAGLIPASTFVHEVTGTSRVFGRDKNITVVFEGSRAETNGETIFYPAIDQQALLTETEVKIGRGFVDHEAAHIRHTDMQFYLRKAIKAHKEGKPLLEKLLNGVEDVRIERLVTKNYVGSRKNLSAVSDAVTQKYLDIYEENNAVSEEIKRTAAVALTWLGRIEMSYVAPNLRKAFETLPEHHQQLCKKWLAELKSDATTQDAYELARKIYHDIENNDVEQPDYLDQQIGIGLPEETPDLEDGDDESTAQGTGDSIEGVSQEEGEEGNDDSSSALPSGFDDTQPFDPDISNYMNENWVNENSPSWGSYRTLSTRFDLVHTIHDTTRKTSTGGNPSAYKGSSMRRNKSIVKYHNRLKTIQPQINLMKRKLERAIEAKARREWEGSKEFGRLDTRRLTSAYRGTPTVYKTRQEAPELDTSITVLIDQSGSMSGRKMNLATDVTVALYETFTKIDVPFEILGWNNYYSFKTDKLRDEFYALRRKEDRFDGLTFHRASPIHLYVYKDYKEKPRAAKEVIPTMVDNVGGWNTDGEALNYAVDRLNKQNTKRKILLVLSDGQPAGDYNNGSEKTFLRNTVHKIETQGIDIVGVGIMSTAVKYYYPQWAICNKLDDLPKKTIDIVAKCLLGNTFVVDNSELINLNGNGETE